MDSGRRAVGLVALCNQFLEFNFDDFIGEFLKFVFNTGSGGRNNFDDGGDIKLSPAKKG